MFGAKGTKVAWMEGKDDTRPARTYFGRFSNVGPRQTGLKIGGLARRF